ncbi:PP2C family protein-serine/threonine phosphatase [Ruicaihuangia caeni]|uniref:Protein phosphatase 2C domain-containing protein n=1 Tax=Ruicaihuangia caeni TaxID=3042517 RepID=A0AAW6T8L6_9MICO|nr:protein phosphatase 2C domain-containing protein [Klugiella sp. YN-L-19]MDI2097487.1 protein phosphatase 2C domain-containing protein [Klugiella sp. YN-L-19]
MTQIGPDVTDHRIVLPGEAGSVTLSWAAVTDTGRKRDHNEDSVIAQAPIFAIADGMGGHSYGDIASDAVVSRLAERLVGTVATISEIEESLVAASGDIDKASETALFGVGTTVTGAAIVVHEGVPSFLVFNVGDSRVYLYDDERLHQVTVDHSVVQEMVDAGLISADEAEQHPDSNVITRAIGFGAAPQPDYWTIALRPGQRLLVCSDGLTKEVPFGRLESRLAERGAAADTARALVEEALEHGGRDNVTLILVDVAEVAEA